MPSDFISYLFLFTLTTGMARPRVVDREGGLQIWRVDVNILNK